MIESIELGAESLTSKSLWKNHPNRYINLYRERWEAKKGSPQNQKVLTDRVKILIKSASGESLNKQLMRLNPVNAWTAVNRIFPNKKWIAHKVGIEKNFSDYIRRAHKKFSRLDAAKKKSWVKKVAESIAKWGSDKSIKALPGERQKELNAMMAKTAGDIQAASMANTGAGKMIGLAIIGVFGIWAISKIGTKGRR